MSLLSLLDAARIVEQRESKGKNYLLVDLWLNVLYCMGCSKMLSL